MLDPQSAIPLYHQLKHALIQGALRSSAHSAIPTERELTEQYGVSRTTVRQAIGELVSDGYLYRLHGKGTYVSPRNRIAGTLSELTGHVEELSRRGLQPSTQVLRQAQEPCPEGVAESLGLTLGDPVARVDRLVTVEGMPLAYIEAYLPAELAQRLPSLGDSLLVSIEAAGAMPMNGRQHITAVQAGAREAEQLGVPVGAALLRVTRTVYGAGAVPLEWSRAWYRADRYEYNVDLRRH